MGWQPCKGPPQLQAELEAALSGKGAGPELGRRRRGWVGFSTVSLLAAFCPAAGEAAEGSGTFLPPAGQEPRPELPLHHDPLAVALLGLLHLGGAARLGADGEVPGRGAVVRLQHSGASKF